MLALALAALFLGEAQGAPAASAPAAAAATARGSSAQPAPKDDFDLLPEEAKPDPAAQARAAELEKRLARRRTLLQAHQLGGFLTLAGLTMTAVLGQLNYNDKYGGGGDTGNWYMLHRWTALSTSAVFVATGALAVFAPVPVEKKSQLDTATLHKIFMFSAAAGMAAEVVLGFYTAGKEGQLSQRDFALAHQLIGYGTLAASLGGFGVLTF